VFASRSSQFLTEPVQDAAESASAASVRWLTGALWSGDAVLLVRVADFARRWLSTERIERSLSALQDCVDCEAEVRQVSADLYAIRAEMPEGPEDPTAIVRVWRLSQALASALANDWSAETSTIPAPVTPPLFLGPGPGVGAQGAGSAETSTIPAPVTPPLFLGVGAPGVGAAGLRLVSVDEAPGGPPCEVLPIARTQDLGSIQANLGELNALLEILINHRLHAQFQPIVALRQGRVVGYEALIRGPKGAPLRRPGQLFRAADRARMVPWFDLACQQRCFERAAAERIRDLLFVNMDAEGLAHQDMMDASIADGATRYGLSPDRIVIEVTERQTVGDFPLLRAAIERMRAFGFKIAVDDAGVGYSSLNAIAELRPEFIKIDHGLIRGVDLNSPKRAMLAAFVDYARNIGTAILAEGIETRDELAALIDIGVPFGQGFLLVRPADQLRGITRELRDFARRRFEGRVLLSTGRQGEIGALARNGKSLQAHEPLSAAARLFRKQPDLNDIVIVEEERPVGHLARTAAVPILDAAASPESPEAARPVAELMSTAPLVVQVDAAVDEVVRQVTSNPGITLDADVVLVDREGRFAGLVGVRALMDAATTVEISRNRYANPLTGPPGRVVLEADLEERMVRKEPMAVIRLDIARLGAFNRTYGIANGDTLIQRVAGLIHDASERCGGPADLIAHLGEDDFVVVTTPDAAEEFCRCATRSFDALLRTLYTPEHVRQGFVDVEQPWGKHEQVGLCALVAAGQTNRSRKLAGYARLMEQLEAALRALGSKSASSYAIDRAA